MGRVLAKGAVERVGRPKRLRSPSTRSEIRTGSASDRAPKANGRRPGLSSPGGGRAPRAPRGGALTLPVATARLIPSRERQGHGRGPVRLLPPWTRANWIHTVEPGWPLSLRCLPLPGTTSNTLFGVMGYEVVVRAAYLRRVMPSSCTVARAFPVPFLPCTTSICSGGSSGGAGGPARVRGERHARENRSHSRRRSGPASARAAGSCRSRSPRWTTRWRRARAALRSAPPSGAP